MQLLVLSLLIIAALADDYFYVDGDTPIVFSAESNTVLTARQVLFHAQNAGFSGQLAHTMVCVAKYESSYNPKAIHKNRNGSIDYGLWQVCSISL
ncbi:hypothetical protein GEMRC1_011588 [Eukaryota sp. GEM-RC1]